MNSSQASHWSAPPPSLPPTNTTTTITTTTTKTTTTTIPPQTKFPNLTNPQKNPNKKIPSLQKKREKKSGNLFTQNSVLKNYNQATSPKLYRSYYPHWSRVSVSPVCGTFLTELLHLVQYFLQRARPHYSLLSFRYYSTLAFWPLFDHPYKVYIYMQQKSVTFEVTFVYYLILGLCCS